MDKKSKHDWNEKSEIIVDSERNSSPKSSLFMRSTSREIATFDISKPALENPDMTTPPKISEKPRKATTLRRLAYLNKPELPLLTAGVITAIANGAILPLYGILVSGVIKSYFGSPHKIREDSKFWALVFVVLGATSLVTYPARTYLFGVAGNKLIRRIRLMCFDKVIKMEIGWFDEPGNSSGVIGSRLSADAAKVRALIGDALAQMVQDLSSVVVGLGIAFGASWQLALIILGMIPLIGLNGYVNVKFLKGFSADAKVSLIKVMVVYFFEIIKSFFFFFSKIFRLDLITGKNKIFLLKNK